MPNPKSSSNLVIIPGLLNFDKKNEASVLVINPTNM